MDERARLMTSRWPSVPFWSIARRIERSGHSDAQLLSVYRDWGVIRKADRDDNFNKASEDLSTYKYVVPGDLVLNKMKTWQGSLGISPFEGIVSPAYFVCHVSDVMHGRYLHYLLRSRPYITMYEANSKGIRTNQWDLPYEALRQIPVLQPTRDEQRRIAEFLDNRVARIDQIISARLAERHLLAQLTASRLQEQQNECVLRYGETRLGRILVGLEQGWSPQAESTEASLDEWGVVRAGCVNDGIFRATDNKRLPDGLEPRRHYELRAGDLLMSRASGSLDKIGSVAIVPADVRSRLLLCDKIYRLRPAPGWDAGFIAPMLRTHMSREAIRLGVSGAEGMANNLPSGVIRGLSLPLVPEELQRTYALAMDALEQRRLAADGTLIESVALLQEYKQSLITAAVTGEIDVTTAGSGIQG